MSSATKVLICGDINENINTIFTRVEKLLKKGNKFDVLFCTGDTALSGDKNCWYEYEDGTKKAPIATYILGNNPRLNSEQDGYELCENITFLGKKGIFTESSGLKVAYLTGTQATSKPTPKNSFDLQDVNAVQTMLNINNGDYKGVDILLTSAWPKSVSRNGNTPTEEKCKSCGSELIAQLTQTITPRYHFAGNENGHYERLPYRNHIVLAESAKPATRFIGLANVGNSMKKKSLYAFTITPMSQLKLKDIVLQPPDTTASPFELTNKQSANQNEQFRWNINQHAGNNGRKRKSNDDFGPEKKQARPQDWSCWFCLGGDKVEKHLVGSVGNLCYVAMAKGGITRDHVLILPIAHHSSLCELPGDTAEEVAKYKEALKVAYKSVGKSCVFFERNYRSDHMQIQMVPVPSSISSDSLWKAFNDLAEGNLDRKGKSVPLTLTDLPSRTDIKQVVAPGCPYFHIELPDGRRMMHRINRFFPLQFGREAMCKKTILNAPDRVDWRSCVPSRDEETAATQAFRDFFKEFDFSLSGDDSDSD